MSAKHRLFVAADVLPQLAPDLAKLKGDLPGARWTRPDQHHLTLQFIGDADDQQLPAIAGALAGIAAPPLTLTVNGVGVFPNPRRPRVLVLHLLLEEGLLLLQGAVQKALSGVGVQPEERPFKAHVTLARFKEADVQAVWTYLNRHADVHLAPFSVSEFHLYESTLKPSGAEYRRVQTYLLS